MCALICVVALVVRFTIRDARQPFALIFYATPWGVIAALSAVSAWCAFRLRLRTRFVFFGLLAQTLVVSLLFILKGWRAEPVRSSSGSEHELRAVFWNVGKPGVDGWRERSALKQVMGRGADLIVLAELSRPGEERSGAWEAAWPHPHTKQLRRQSLLLSRFPIKLVASDHLRKFGDFSLLEIESPEGGLFLLVVDVDAIPDHPRAPPLGRVAELAAAYETKPLLILGDFNTPSDSVHFVPLRKHARSAWEIAGQGWGPTWPNPVPVMELDQAWVSPKIDVRKAEHFETFYSDHRPLIVDFAIQR
jgi:endonuclease/exonuclease/phosphatase (EEP) superfamily protein YafD